MKYLISILILALYMTFIDAKLIPNIIINDFKFIELTEIAEDHEQAFDMNLYLTQLAYYESSNNFKAQNGQHVGLYQLSKKAYKDLVKYKKLDIDFDSIKHNVKHQRHAQLLFMQRQHDLFVHYDLLQYIGKDIVYVHANDIDTTHYKLNLASMYAASHLVGCKNLKRWIVDEDCNPLTDICDGNKVSIAEYAYYFKQ